MRLPPAAPVLVAILSCSAVACGQSLFQQAPPPIPVGTEAHQPEVASPLYSVSLFAVAPPKPRAYKVHNLITIIVDESSSQTADQTLKTDKKYNLDATVNSIVDFQKLLELQLRQGNLSNVSLINTDSNQKFDSKGNYSRNDKLTMKIQAEIIDVKPNGVLVVEAKKTLDKNGETQTTILSGACRQEDVTQNNSVFSSQLANLTLVTKSEGSVNDAAKKGWIPRVLEAVFAF